jgi:hypothetical protein
MHGLHFSARATLPTITFLVVIHGTVLASLFAVWFVRRKSPRANYGRHKREQDFPVIFHRLSLGGDGDGR